MKDEGIDRFPSPSSHRTPDRTWETKIHTKSSMITQIVGRIGLTQNSDEGIARIAKLGFSNVRITLAASRGRNKPLNRGTKQTLQTTVPKVQKGPHKTTTIQLQRGPKL